MRRFASLRRRAEFARLRQRGRRIATPALTLYQGEAARGDERPVVGISVSKAVGTAIVRNTVRRRISEILHLALAGRSPFRLLVVARPVAAERSFGDLRAEVERALA